MPADTGSAPADTQQANTDNTSSGSGSNQ
jgi:hypothetical protein